MRTWHPRSEKYGVGATIRTRSAPLAFPSSKSLESPILRQSPVQNAEWRMRNKKTSKIPHSALRIPNCFSFSNLFPEIDFFTHHVNRLALGLVVGAGVQFSQEPQNYELNAGEQEKGGQDQERV